MAAQARHYESKGIPTYPSRQVDEKMIPKVNRTSFSKQSSLGSSPYSKSNSPLGKKRALESPSSRHGSPYERKRERMNSDGKTFENQVESDWSQHWSSSGKVYYYNKKTEESQWEVPKEWRNREKQYKPSERQSKDSRELKDSRYSRSSRDEYESKDRDRDRERDRYNKEKREYRESRKDREYCSSGKERDRYRDRDKEGKDGGTPNTNGRYRNSNSENSRYSSSVKSIGHSTPSSYTSSSSRSLHYQTPERINGTVQDISPPGTPTNDDIMNMSHISTQNPAFTPHGRSPHINNSLTPVAQHLVMPAVVHAPLLSPNLLMNSTNLSTTALLHPLQQALLMQQQLPAQIQPKDVYTSPKLPTIKNHFNDRGGSCPSSPLVTNFHQNNMSHSSPSHHSIQRSNSSTPPPPPPPKESQTPNDRHDRYHRLNSSYDGRHSITVDSPKEILNRSKSYDHNRLDETPHRPLNHRNDAKYLSDRNSKKSTAKLFGQEQLKNDLFKNLPDLGNHMSYYSSNIVDFTHNFYGNVLEKQATEGWNEFHGTTHVTLTKSKNNLLLSSESMTTEDVRLNTASSWYNALDDVLSKIEQLRDNLRSSKHQWNGNSSSRKSSSSTKPIDSNSNCSATSTAAGSVVNVTRSSSSTTTTTTTTNHENSNSDPTPRVNGTNGNETPPPPPRYNTSSGGGTVNIPLKTQKRETNNSEGPLHNEQVR